MNELEDQVFEYMGKCIKTFFKCGGKKDKSSDECQRRSEGGRPIVSGALRPKLPSSKTKLL